MPEHAGRVRSLSLESTGNSGSECAPGNQCPQRAGGVQRQVANGTRRLCSLYCAWGQDADSTRLCKVPCEVGLVLCIRAGGILSLHQRTLCACASLAGAMSTEGLSSVGGGLVVWLWAPRYNSIKH